MMIISFKYYKYRFLGNFRLKNVNLWFICRESLFEQELHWTARAIMFIKDISKYDI